MILKSGKLLLAASFLHDEIEVTEVGFIKNFEAFT